MRFSRLSLDSCICRSPRKASGGLFAFVVCKHNSPIIPLNPSIDNEDHVISKMSPPCISDAQFNPAEPSAPLSNTFPSSSQGTHDFYPHLTITAYLFSFYSAERRIPNTLTSLDRTFGVCHPWLYLTPESKHHGSQLRGRALRCSVPRSTTPSARFSNQLKQTGGGKRIH